MDFSLEEADNCSAWYLVYILYSHWAIGKMNDGPGTAMRRDRQQRNSSDAVACIFSGKIFFYLIFILFFK